MNTCLRCKRPLRDKGSIEKGLGPICAAKVLMETETQNKEGETFLFGVGSVLEAGLVCQRLEDGRMACNVTHVFVHHSPTGFEIAYQGSGPADLALNVLARFLPLKAGERGVRLWNGVEVSQSAWALHQEFKRQFIATLPESGGAIRADAIRAYIEKANHLQASLIDDEVTP